MSKDDLLSQLNDGRTANVLLQWMDPIFKDVERDLLNSLKSNFRQGTYSELLLACHVAQLCSLEDLQTRIKGIAARGDSAATKINEPDEDDGDLSA
jgi:hypothetical protein